MFMQRNTMKLNGVEYIHRKHSTCTQVIGYYPVKRLRDSINNDTDTKLE